MQDNKLNISLETLDEKDVNVSSTMFASENQTLNNSINNLSLMLDEKTDIEKQDEYIYDEKVYGNEIKVKEPMKMGNVFTFLYYKTHPMFVIGPDYLLTVGLFACINIVNYLLFQFVYNDLSDFLYYLGLTIYLTQTISHTLTACINPGIPSREHYITKYVKETSLSIKRSKESGYKICRICNIIVHERNDVAHCEDCNICVEGQDHHCAWSGKCIGRINLYPFYVFVFSTFLFILMTFLSTMIYLVTYADRLNNGRKK